MVMLDDQPHGALKHQEVAVLGDQPLTLGFRLAGVRTYSVVEEADQEGFDRQLSRMLDTGELGIIIVGERHLSKINADLERKMMGRLFPLVVGVPDKQGEGQTSDPLMRMLKRSLGIDLSVKE
jgi:V/A-type H+/Na+-transporting ATPase subunit F